MKCKPVIGNFCSASAGRTVESAGALSKCSAQVSQRHYTFCTNRDT